MFGWDSKEMPSMATKEKVDTEVSSLGSERVELQNQSEEERQKITDKISEARSFAELYQSLDDLEGLEIGQDKLSPKELKFFIGLVNTGRADVNSISEAYGLKDKVVELLGSRKYTKLPEVEIQETLPEDKKEDKSINKVDDIITNEGKVEKNIDHTEQNNEEKELEFEDEISRQELEAILDTPSINLKDFSFIGPEDLFGEEEFKTLLSGLVDKAWEEKERAEESGENISFDIEINLKDKLIGALKERRLEKGFTVQDFENKYLPFSDEARLAYEDWDREQVNKVISSLKDVEKIESKKIEKLKEWVAYSLARGENWEDLNYIKEKYLSLWDMTFAPGSTDRLSVDEAMDNKKFFIFPWLSTKDSNVDKNSKKTNSSRDGALVGGAEGESEKYQDPTILEDISDSDNDKEVINTEEVDRIREMVKEKDIDINSSWLADILKNNVDNTLLEGELASLAELLGFDLQDREVKRGLVMLQRVYSKSPSLDNFKTEGDDLIKSALEEIERKALEDPNLRRLLNGDKLGGLEKTMREEIDRVRIERLKDDLNKLIVIFKKKIDNENELKLLLSNMN